MYEFDDFTVMVSNGKKDGQELPRTAVTLGNWLEEVIFALPYWRENDEAAGRAEEVLEQIEAKVKTYVVRDATLEALQSQMKLINSPLMQQNPSLVRASIRFLRIVNGARRKLDPLPARSEQPEAAQAS